MKERIELKISCKKLDVLSNSALQVLLSVKDAKTQKWRPTSYKTEVIKNNLNPTFVTGFVVDYVFEELQEFRFICVNDTNREHQDFIGQFECDLGSIVASEGGKMVGFLTSPNHPGKNHGLIIISADSKRNLKLQFQACNIVNKGKFFGAKATTFLVISRANENNTFSPVYESDVVSSSSPCWKELYIRESTLCNGDSDAELQLQVKQYKKDGEHILLGECSVTLREIMGRNKIFPLKLQPGSQRKISKDANITVVKALVPPSFLDYIAGGTKIRLMVAIDFTESNGDPRSQRSLHYSGGRENDYQRAIRTYGYDRLFSVYGFGAKFNGILSHAYPLNNDHQNPQVEGVEGMLSLYLQTLNTVELYGPTNFSPIIKLTANKIESELGTGNVNGVITDMDLTIRSIINASSLPLSIVIVGVGDADFSYMARLGGPLVSKSDEALSGTIGRSIVQFIAMKDYQAEAAGYSLPKVLLEGIPDKFLDYMNKNKIPPKSINKET
ncbi:9172_t:CDS:10 [Entrophospora sp. SA101]|nr:14050_t:CDS:10 [Entrophospora sp. SA101]CAJ0860550.1 13517_t:CDS:10 [Entrophospora sp. SA101]CAJ0909823.1 9172_t:CDS:10 [Entrophospora sp. SA101]